MAPTKRYYSLDVFRGATIAFMILVNNPGSWSAIFPPLEHSAWNGCTPTDLVFPFFLFAVGNALTFVIPKMRKKGASAFWKKIIKRSFLIFFIGLLLNWFPFFHWEHGEIVFTAWNDNAGHGVRILGVLQRIAITYFFAAIIAYYSNERTVLKLSFIILVLYWLAVKYLAIGDPYTMEHFIGTHLDIRIFGIEHVYHGDRIPFDPEGLVSSIPGISQILFGYLAGNFIQSHGNLSWFGKKVNEHSTAAMLAGLLVIATILMAISYLWQLDFPYNKKMWSSSYVLLTTGLALLTLGLLIWFIEVLHFKSWLFKFFDAFGKNPLFIYVFSGVLYLSLAFMRIEITTDEGKPQLTDPLTWFYQNICAPVSDNPAVGSALYALIFVFVCWVVAWWLDKRKIYIKV